MDDFSTEVSDDELKELQEGINRQRKDIIQPNSSYDIGKQEDGLDKNTVVFLRTAKIWNPKLDELNPVSTNNLEVKSAVNESTGRVILTLNLSGFVSPVQQNMTSYTNISYNPEDRTFDEVQNSSNEEKIPLTYPFIWVGQDTWCGFNYLPPLNSEVIIGFGKRHDAYILGFLNRSYKECYPCLKPGEICIKGAGNNYIHNRWSNKLDLYAASSAGDQDKDAASREESAADDCTLWIRLDADNGHIELTATGGGAGQSSGIFISPTGIKLQALGKTIVSLDSGGITMTGATISKNAGNEDQNAAMVTDNR